MGQSISLKKTAGFTLLELLMVIAILSIVTFVSIGKISDTTDEERFQKTIQQMKEIRNAMIGNPDLKTGSHRNSFGYLGDIGQIPSAGQGIGALITNPGFPAWALSSITRIGMGWNGPYLSASDSGVNYLKDAWGTPYVYSPGTTPPTLVSLGADRVVGGSGMNADITLLLPSTLTQATLHGVILNGGTQWAQDAEIELNFPNGAGVLAQTLQAVAPADLGAFTVATVPMGIRSITL